MKNYFNTPVYQKDGGKKSWKFSRTILKNPKKVFIF